MSILVGIDIGASGALAYFDTETRELLSVEDMPIHKVQIGTTLRSRIDRFGLLNLLYQAKSAQVFVERPDYRPMRGTDKATDVSVQRHMGTAGAGSFGEGYGCVLMGCAAAGMSLTEVRAGQWKREIGVSGDKDTVRRRAAELYPSMADLFARKKDDGRADAVLLGYYGLRKLNTLR